MNEKRLRLTTLLWCSLASGAVIVAIPAGTGRAEAPPGRPAPEARTTVTIVDGRWRLDGAVTYRGAPAEGLMMNVRMVNAVFEDLARPGFDPEVVRR